jgi:hypothetical protein
MPHSEIKTAEMFCWFGLWKNSDDDEIFPYLTREEGEE